MLYYLLYEVLRKYISPLNVFRYITVRTVYASLTAMFLALVFGPALIRRLRELQIGQFIREEGPQEHKKKAGTPTDRKSTRLNSSHTVISYAVFCLKKKKKQKAASPHA